MTPGDDGVEVEFDAPEATLAAAQQLVDEGHLPEYRSVDDIFRDAMVHYLARRWATFRTLSRG